MLGDELMGKGFKFSNTGGSDHRGGMIRIPGLKGTGGKGAPSDRGKAPPWMAGNNPGRGFRDTGATAIGETMSGLDRPRSRIAQQQHDAVEQEIAEQGPGSRYYAKGNDPTSIQESVEAWNIADTSFGLWTNVGRIGSVDAVRFANEVREKISKKLAGRI